MGLDGACVKACVPLTIAFGGRYLSSTNESRQIEIAQSNQKDAVIREYIKEMKGMLLDKKVAREAMRPSSQANGVARALTLAALAQLKGEDPERRSLVFQFLRESNFPILAGSGKIRGANLSNYDLRGTDLYQVNLSHALLVSSDLRKIDLINANLHGASLNFAKLGGAFLGGTDLSYANLWRADVSGARFDMFRFEDGIEVGSSLYHADLLETNLAKAHLRKADLRGANLRKANLRETDLTEANLRGARLDGAHFEGAIFWQTICPDGTKTNKGCPVPAARQ